MPRDDGLCWAEHPRAMMVFCRQPKGHADDHVGASGVIRWRNEMTADQEPGGNPDECACIGVHVRGHHWSCKSKERA